MRAMLFLPLTRIGFRLMGFRRCRELALQLSAPRHGPGPLNESARKELVVRAAKAVRSAEINGIGNPTCLERSLVLWWLLRRGGVTSVVRIGVRKSESLFEAHAWVEIDGEVLNDSTDVHTQYSRFTAPIAAEKADLH